MTHAIWPDSRAGEQVELVYRERIRQEELKRTGKFKHTCADKEMSDAECLAVLAEEFGEVAREVCEGMTNPLSLKRLHSELIQVAAVAVAWAERTERAAWEASRPKPEEHTCTPGRDGWCARCRNPMTAHQVKP